MPLPKLADVIPLANFLARTITSGILSRVQRRLQRHVETRKRLEIAAPGKRPSKGTDSPARCKLRRNCGEIRYVYPPGGLCGASSDRYTRLRLRMNRLFPIIPRPTFLSSFLLSNPREITRLCNCVETAFKTQEDLLHNPLLKSSYVVIFGRNQYVVRI